MPGKSLRNVKVRISTSNVDLVVHLTSNLCLDCCADIGYTDAKRVMIKGWGHSLPKAMSRIGRVKIHPWAQKPSRLRRPRLDAALFPQLQQRGDALSHVIAPIADMVPENAGDALRPRVVHIAGETAMNPAKPRFTPTCKAQRINPNSVSKLPKTNALNCSDLSESALSGETKPSQLL